MTDAEDASDRRVGHRRTRNRPHPRAGDRQLGDAVAALTDDDIEPAQRRRLLGRLAAAVRERGVGGLFKPKAALRWMVDAVTDVAPHCPSATWRRCAGTTTAWTARSWPSGWSATRPGPPPASGAAGGGVAAVEWAVTPTLLTAPVLLAVETVAVVASR